MQEFFSSLQTVLIDTYFVMLLLHPTKLPVHDVMGVHVCVQVQLQETTATACFRRRWKDACLRALPNDPIKMQCKACIPSGKAFTQPIRPQANHHRICNNHTSTLSFLPCKVINSADNHTRGDWSPSCWGHTLRPTSILKKATSCYRRSSVKLVSETDPGTSEVMKQQRSEFPAAGGRHSRRTSLLESALTAPLPPLVTPADSLQSG